MISKIYLAEDVSDVEMKLFKDICEANGISRKLLIRQSIYGRPMSKRIVFAK